MCRLDMPAGPFNYCHRFFAKDTPGLAFGSSGYNLAHGAATSALTEFVIGIATAPNVQWQTVVTYGTAGDVCRLQPPPPPSCPTNAIFGGVSADTLAFDSDASTH